MLIMTSTQDSRVLIQSKLHLMILSGLTMDGTILLVLQLLSVSNKSRLETMSFKLQAHRLLFMSSKLKELELETQSESLLMKWKFLRLIEDTTLFSNFITGVIKTLNSN